MYSLFLYKTDITVVAIDTLLLILGTMGFVDTLGQWHLLHQEYDLIIDGSCSCLHQIWRVKMIDYVLSLHRICEALMMDNRGLHLHALLDQATSHPNYLHENPVSDN